ncbi:hypothetical protein J2S75_003668 [Ancylobacter polymorphus]|uniref:Transposase n=1 Tax=Ancylobacter polymorphus TaxID=223390 RepID=A0ABU0BFK3_9HYPH|nr:hypothetical protein [Ancylobacter polymorphus]
MGRRSCRACSSASSTKLACAVRDTRQPPYFSWKKKYEGLAPLEMRRLKQVEDENTKLRKLVADLSLDREMLQDHPAYNRSTGSIS